MKIPSGDVFVLGLDTGFSNIGLAVVNLGTTLQATTLVEITHFETEKAATKKRVREADDRFARTRLIARNVHAVMRRYPAIRAVCFESMSPVRNSGVMAKIGMCFGVVATLVELTDLPVLESSPQEIKKAVCGAKGATKEDIQKQLDALFKGSPKAMLDVAGLAQGKREHPYDALGAIVAGWDTEVMRLLRTQVKS